MPPPHQPRPPSHPSPPPLPPPVVLLAAQSHLNALSLPNNAVSNFVLFSLQVNVLAYFETLCTDTGAANVLINSSLTILIVRMLRNARAPTLRVRLASALGLLVRHATYIADELATTGEMLLSCLQTCMSVCVSVCLSVHV